MSTRYLYLEFRKEYMRGFKVFMFLVFCFLGKTKQNKQLLVSFLNLAGHATSRYHIPQSPQRGKKEILYVRKRVFGSSLPAAGWKGSDAGVLSASWRLCRRKRQIIWLPCNLLFRTGWQSWRSLPSSSQQPSTTMSTPEPPTISTFRHGEDVGCLERRQEGAGIEFEKSERYQSPLFCMVTLFCFSEKENFSTRDQPGQLQSRFRVWEGICSSASTLSPWNTDILFFSTGMLALCFLMYALCTLYMSLLHDRTVGTKVQRPGRPN